MAQQASTLPPAGSAASAPASSGAVTAPVPASMAPGGATPAPAPAPAPQPRAALPAQLSAPVNASSYRINPGDDLEIYVWGEERLQREVKVLPDGTFAFPLVGRIPAQGRLPSDIETLISRALEGQYRGQVPQVTVSVRQASGLVFSVMGRVNGAGTFSPGRYVNVLEALSIAGGPAEFANLDNVTIIRKTPNGGLTTMRVRLAGVFRGNVSGDDITSDRIPQIQSGDTVLVP